MRRLSDERVELLDAILAESGHADLSAALLEKDEHLTDALRALFDLRLEGMNLALCGGTSLAKAFEVIERMSEDVDIKAVLLAPLHPHAVGLYDALRTCRRVAPPPPDRTRHAGTRPPTRATPDHITGGTPLW